MPEFKIEWKPKTADNQLIIRFPEVVEFEAKGELVFTIREIDPDEKIVLTLTFGSHSRYIGECEMGPNVLEAESFVPGLIRCNKLIFNLDRKITRLNFTIQL